MTGTNLRYREIRPVAALRPYVECLWMVWDPVRRAGRPLETIVPDASPEIIVHLGDPFARRVGDRWVRQPRAFLAGTLTGPWTLRAGRNLRTLGMRFRPGAVTALFPIDMQQAADREVALDEILDAAATRDLVRELCMAAGTADCMRRAERWLVRRLATGSSPGITRSAVRLILASRGRKRIAAVAEALGVTPRRLERAFARDLGIRPKLFSRIVRLNAALAALGEAQRVRAVELALAAGYFDQAHMARDFKAVAGRTPGARAGAAGELSPHFTQPKRLLEFLTGE